MVATENIGDFMSNHALNSSTGRLQILTRIEVTGMLDKMLTNAGSHCHTQIRVDVDLANGHSGGLAELILGYAESTGHIAAKLVDLLSKLLRHRGSTMEMQSYFTNADTPAFSFARSSALPSSR